MSHKMQIEPIGQIEMFLRTADVTDYPAAVGSLDFRYARCTDYADRQLLGMSEEEVRALDIGNERDQEHIIDIALLVKDSFKDVVEIPPFFLRVVDGLNPERRSKIVTVSRTIHGRWRFLPFWSFD